MRPKPRTKATPHPSVNLKPTVLVLLSTSIFLLVSYVNPSAPGAIPLFFTLIFLAIFVILSTVMKNVRRILTFSFFVCFFLVLRYFDLGNILNLLLLVGTIIAFEFFLSNHS